jgi:hypothetical protein
MSNEEDAARVPASADATTTVRCVQAPPWVKCEPWPPQEEQSLGACSDNGLLRVLYDSQIGLVQPGVAWHIRAVQRILTRAGAERAAHVAIEFNPAHERLEIHCIRVLRGEQSIEHARPADFQILRRETQLERLALDGRLTATLLIPDLRVDDHLEVAFTIATEDPILSGRCAGWLVFNAYAPWIETRQRLVRPIGRPVFLNAFNDPPQASVSVREDVEESVWSLRGQERETVEDLLTPWSVKNPCYQVTEFERWGDISQLFEKYYRDSEIPAELVTDLDRLASEHPEESERAVEWLRMVQRQLRYFALALGEGGLVPRSLPEIWAKRFGDCKDAVRLYVAGARYLGLDACAALVSTSHGMSLADFLPSPQVFNHVVVRVRAGGGTYWLDPTLQPQGGSLADIAPFQVGWALPLTPDTNQLEPLPATQALQHILCEDTIRFGPKADSPAQLDRRIEFGFWAADSIRNRIEGEGVTKVSTQLLQDLRTTSPDAIERSPLQIEDDFAHNRLRVLCAYEIRNCWKGGDKQGRLGFDVADPFVVKELAPLKSTRRKADIFLGRPRKTTWRARLQMPCEWRGTGFRQPFNDAGIRFTNELTVQPREVVLERDVELDAWSVPPDKADFYAQIADGVRRNVVTLWARADLDGNIGPTVTTGAAGGAGSSGSQRKSPSYGWAALLLIAPLFGLLRLVGSSVETNSTAESAVVTPLVSPGSNLLDQGSHSSFVTAPEVHVSSFDRLTDTPLDRCIETGRDSIGPYLHSDCNVSAKVRVARPYGGDPWEGMISPGGKAYVYFLEMFGSDTDGAVAACPSLDQIVESSSGLPWTRRGVGFKCQHSRR